MRNTPHPELTTLALYWGGELGWLRRLLLSRHVRVCAECRRNLRGFEGSGVWLKETASRQPPVAEAGSAAWDALAAEMTANIRVGLAEAACHGSPSGALVAAPSARTQPAWQMLVAVAGTVLLAVVLFWSRFSAPVLAPAPVAAVDPSGSRTLIVPFAHGARLPDGGGAKPKSDKFYPSSPDSLRVRYVDAETGQVTINHVYTE
jgi:hypothetical protein